MTQINSNGQTWLFVPAPENTSKEEVYDTLNDGHYIDYFVGVNEDYVDKQKLPEGDWSIHCHSTNVTEKQAAEIVTNEGTAERPMYTDYTYPFSGYDTAIPSLATLVDAHDIATPYIVLKLKQDAPVQVEQTKRKRKTKKTSK